MKRSIVISALFVAVQWAAAQEMVPMKIKVENDEGQMLSAIYKPRVPLILDRADNVAYELSFNCPVAGDVLNSVSLDLADTAYIQSVRLYYSGGMSVMRSRTSSQAIVQHFSEVGGGQSVFMRPDYSIKLAEVKAIAPNITINIDKTMVAGDNYFWISMELRPCTPLSAVIRSSVSRVMVNGMSAGGSDMADSRVGVAVRNAGDDGVHSYRIPGLVTSRKGTLLGVYDIRRHTSFDLQESVDVGLSRSVDGGQTWDSMQVIMDMGQWGGLPDAQNGIGDPSILVDEVTERVWCIALWTHAMGNARAWQASRQGMTPEDQTGQLMITHSDNDGLTWSEPRNITSQVKDPATSLMLQGPGRGISMADGTLVFPVQYIDSTKLPHASIIYSKDRGQTWQAGVSAHPNTTEAQVVEYPRGTLMLNIRNNSGRSRIVAETRDMGRTWSKHPSSESALSEPVCMASLIKTTYRGRDILLFSNPNSTVVRENMTIKASLDGGITWKEANQLVVDQELSWGYSCLSMVDADTLGILYEGSTAQMVFQAVDLDDIIKDWE